eukprot:TRINITY_DN9528_c0_g1_i3.p1 TRINITY_DN9528_c0_g1~~TRINITY_DN9528_c0_g1_i3.p1  ORF type:complete len:394 (-),score=59.34 TRINITY_DN9528_c0_g1_i3:48-1229(-)
MLIRAIIRALVLFVAYIAYQHVYRPFPAVIYTLPPPPALENNNTLLQSATKYHSDQLIAPETIAFHPNHTMYTGCYDGQIFSVSPYPTFTLSHVSYTGYASSLLPEQTHLCTLPGNHWLCGRPLGMVFKSSDTLIIADGYHGLLSYDLSSRTFTSLWNHTQYDTNSVTLSEDGDTIYFTAASGLFRNFEVMYDAISGQCSGALLSYTFSTNSTRFLARDLCFPNGVLLLNAHTLLYAETNSASLTTLDLRTLKITPVATNLPCLPDNLEFDKGSRTHYWFGCGGPLRMSSRFSFYDSMGQWPSIRKLLVYLLPYPMIKKFAVPEAMIVRMAVVDANTHRISDVMMDPTGSVLDTTTGAHWNTHDDSLWLTSYKTHVKYMARVKWSPPPPTPNK